MPHLIIFSTSSAQAGAADVTVAPVNLKLMYQQLRNSIENHVHASPRTLPPSRCLTEIVANYSSQVARLFGACSRGPHGGQPNVEPQEKKGPRSDSTWLQAIE
ncbi:hypothetical protein BDW22DRAFT_1418454 [Trametopsis cervina]|nr:hypothetical protein BDW22DRAFT_1418454 [Trametopsis cervina]